MQDSDKIAELENHIKELENKFEGYNQIIRNGCPEPPESAKICPCCGHDVQEYIREFWQPPPWRDIGSDFCGVLGNGFEDPMVPTFICPKCTCKWQWLPLSKTEDEKQEPEKAQPSEDASEKQEPHVTAIQITVGAKVERNWFERLLDRLCNKSA